MKRAIGIFLLLTMGCGGAVAAKKNSESGGAPYATYDLGLSVGNSGSRNYSELDVGLNYFFKNWFAWRNAVFARFINPENIYGLDTSGRFFHYFPSATIFGGPGYRFASLGDNVPFLEGGAVLHLGGFSIGGGAKTFLTNVIRKGAAADTLYFIILSGSGTL